MVAEEDSGRLVLYTLSSSLLKSGDVADLSTDLDSLSLDP